MWMVGLVRSVLVARLRLWVPVRYGVLVGVRRDLLLVVQVPVPLVRPVSWRYKALAKTTSD